jgi:hypothetical protein
MNATLARNIELNVDRCASAIFGAAVAYASLEWLRALAQPADLAISALFAIGSYLLCRRLLGTLSERQADFRVPIFDAIAPALVDELLLGDADRLVDELVLTEGDKVSAELLLTDADRLAQASDDPLVLDDILEAIGPDSRVVRMFDRRAMPTPGDLQSRIDARIDAPSPVMAPVDASQELTDALAELRKALR